MSKNTLHALQLQTSGQELETGATYTGFIKSITPLKYIFPGNRLSRNSTDISNMSEDNPDKP